MTHQQRTYIAIDLKSFYASVECVERHLDPLSTNLVVADIGRTEKTICLAVSPSLKAHGISGRARLFEVIQKVHTINGLRLCDAIKEGKAIRDEQGKYRFSGSSFDAHALAQDPSLQISYITAPPHMAKYMEYSTRIYHIYLKYIAPEDIHVYSIDEVFMDVTQYLAAYKMTAHELAMTMIRDVLYTTGITATGGIGTNLYLAKIAMDIVAKHVPPNQDGVRIAELNEQTYRELLWTHTPLTDFWRIGHGYANKLNAHGIYTMGDIARCSLGKSSDYWNAELLYKLFGVNAELLIDHAWGWEPTTIALIRQYKPEARSLSSGQVLHSPYPFDKARLIVHEMTDLLVLDLVEKGLATNQIVLTIGYDIENLKNGRSYGGTVVTDYYGRNVPKHAHGTSNLSQYSSSTMVITHAMLELFDRIADKTLFIRRITVTANHVAYENSTKLKQACEQLDFFTDYHAIEQKRLKESAALEREKRIQRAVIGLKKRYGKNAVLKGMNLKEGAMTIQRNAQVGGHQA